MPGATPAAFQNDQTDTPGRSLRTFVNGTNPNSNNTRLDGASSVNIWLPHHVGYVAPAETIDTVNISTNNFDAGQGMAGGAAITLVTKSGTNRLKGSAFYFRNQDELNARHFFDPVKLDSSISIGGGTVGGPIQKNRLFFFGVLRGQLRAQQPVRHLHGADGAHAQRRLQRGARRSTRASGSTTRRPATPTAPGARSSRAT